MGEHRMNIMKADLKELYFKRQAVLTWWKYVNKLKEFYNTLEEINQPYFEEQKVIDLLYHIMCPAYQFKACVQTARKDFKTDFAGACTYLYGEISRIVP